MKCFKAKSPQTYHLLQKCIFHNTSTCFKFLCYFAQLPIHYNDLNLKTYSINTSYLQMLFINSVIQLDIFTLISSTVNSKKTGRDFVLWVFIVGTGRTSRKKFSKGQPGKERPSQQQAEGTAQPVVRRKNAQANPVYRLILPGPALFESSQLLSIYLYYQTLF